MSKQNNNIKKSFAIILDCDGTIAKDTTTQLIDQIGGNSKKFWEPINKRYKEGWDPSLLWMPELIKYAASLKKPLSIDLFSSMGKEIDFYQGIPNFFKSIKDWFSKEVNRLNLQLDLKIFIITGGLEDLILKTKIKYSADDIYGCTYYFDKQGLAIQPKSSITFTEKTRFIFSINKGIEKVKERKDPGLVNQYTPNSKRKIPLDKTIYIGDGPTDIPCFTIINRAGG
jgi:2-hydroxy-3-keto-5-methylthiopentenyl-1-phosphate phosphatase